MDSDKSRGLKHIKDKRKYKGNSTKIAMYVPPKSQPNLESNWYRYQDGETTEDQEDLTVNSDFSVLAKAPITKGNHFQTKSEKLLASETESTAFDGLFSLNLGTLEESLLAIPFYKRIGVDEKYFSDSQIHDMNRASEEHMKKFLKLNESTVCKSPLKQKDKISKDFSIKSKEIIKNEPIQDLVPKTTEILENLVLADNSIVKKDSEENSKENPEELEKWLDDFLNE